MALGALASLYCASHAAHAQCVNRLNLTDYDRRLFINASYGQQAEVDAEFPATLGCNDAMFSSLGRLGAKVRYSDNKVGYVLVTLPKESLLDALDIPGIEDATITHIYNDDSIVLAANRKVSPLPPIELPFPQVSTTLSGDGPYFAADEAGLTALWKQHPEADGRDVCVAVVDGGIDLLHPAKPTLSTKSETHEVAWEDREFHAPSTKLPTINPPPRMFRSPANSQSEIYRCLIFW